MRFSKIERKYGTKWAYNHCLNCNELRLKSYPTNIFQHKSQLSPIWQTKIVCRLTLNAKMKRNRERKPQSSWFRPSAWFSTNIYQQWIGQKLLTKHNKTRDSEKASKQPYLHIKKAENDIGNDFDNTAVFQSSRNSHMYTKSADRSNISVYDSDVTNEVGTARKMEKQ